MDRQEIWEKLEMMVQWDPWDTQVFQGNREKKEPQVKMDMMVQKEIQEIKGNQEIQDLQE